MNPTSAYTYSPSQACDGSLYLEATCRPMRQVVRIYAEQVARSSRQLAAPLVNRCGVR